jgi:threonine synthase
LPQQFYYFFAYKQWAALCRSSPGNKKHPPVICVPSGNFGNICAGLLANSSGLPVQHFVAACNVNDVVTDYLDTADFKPKPATATLSNAMDVGNPSNFIRILEIFHHEFPALKDKLSSYSITDAETTATIKEVYQQYDYLLDPHGAVGYLALTKYLNAHADAKGIFLETAHPVKFPDAVEKVTGKKINIPESLKTIMNQEKKSTVMKPFYYELKNFLIK